MYQRSDRLCTFSGVLLVVVVLFKRYVYNLACPLIS